MRTEITIFYKMKKLILNLALLFTAATATAQTQLPNAGFESWTSGLPNGYYDNTKGSFTASLGPATASKSTDAHSGSASVLIETKDYPLAKVNGNLTTGYVNAPSTSKNEGYIGTHLHNDQSKDRRVPFTDRPDSLVGWFKYTPANNNQEKAKVRVVLHTGHFYDPGAPVNNNHSDLSANEIGSATFISDNQTYSTWVRFSVPFTYLSSVNPDYILFTATSSNNQLTNTAGSKLWLDDIQLIYNTCDAPTSLSATDNNNGSISASWTAPAAAPSNGYLVAVAPQGTTPAAGDYVTVNNTTYTTSSYNGSPLVTGTTYVVHVKSDCGSLESAEATANVTFTYAPPAGCDAPTGLTLTETTTGNKINAVWTAPATAPSNGYLYAVLPQGTTAVASDFVASATTSVSNIAATTNAGAAPLAAGSAYTVTVKSDCGNDGASSIITKDITLQNGVGVNIINGAVFSVYSSSQEVIVDFSDVTIENGVISIIDLSGKRVATANLTSKAVNTIALPSNITTGVYVYQIEGKNVTKTGKLVF